MKYELNTPYDFEVKDVIETDDTLNFMVDVGGTLFPVKGYREQMKGGTKAPSSVSCRIKHDKDKNAYLIQNEAFLYPIIYIKNKRYIFEVADIRDNYAVLKDKHGLFHAMEFDGTTLSPNEIIVRCVEVIKDNDYKVHLRFYYSDLAVEHVQIENETDSKKLDEHTITNVERIQASPVENQMPLNKIQENGNKSIMPEIPQHPDHQNSVTSILLSQNWEELKLYMDNNFKGAHIPIIQNEISSLLKKCDDDEKYWCYIKFLLNYDANMFINIIATINSSKLPLAPIIDDDSFDEVVIAAFNASKKIKHAIELVYPYKQLINESHKKIILSKSVGLNSYESFYDLFSLLKLQPDTSIQYLLSLNENVCAAYTIYKFYADGKNANIINESSRIQSLRPSKIGEYIGKMKKMSNAFILAADLIDDTIWSIKSRHKKLIKDIDEQGYAAFYRYISTNEQQITVRNTLKSLNIGSDLVLKYIKEIDNYYLLIHVKTDAYALLDKKLTVKEPDIASSSRAIIAKKMSHKGKTVFIVRQKPEPASYAYPPLANNNTILDVCFSQGANHGWYPVVKNHFKLMSLNVVSRPRYIDYKLTHKAKIVRREDFFTYEIAILDEHNTTSEGGFFSRIANRFLKGKNR